MSFFSPVKQLSFFFFNKTTRFFFSCYGTKTNVSAIPVGSEKILPTGHLGYDLSQVRDGALIMRTGTAYQTLVADYIRKTLNLKEHNLFKCINNVDTENDPAQHNDSSPDITLTYGAVTLGIEVKELDCMGFGSTSLVFYNPLEAVETLLDFNK